MAPQTRKDPLKHSNLGGSLYCERVGGGRYTACHGATSSHSAAPIRGVSTKADNPQGAVGALGVQAHLLAQRRMEWAKFPQQLIGAVSSLHQPCA